MSGINQSYYTVSDKDLFGAGEEISGLTWWDGTDTGFTITIGDFTTVDNTEQVSISISFGE